MEIHRRLHHKYPRWTNLMLKNGTDPSKFALRRRWTGARNGHSDFLKQYVWFAKKKNTKNWNSWKLIRLMSHDPQRDWGQPTNATMTSCRSCHNIRLFMMYKNYYDIFVRYQNDTDDKFGIPWDDHVWMKNNHLIRQIPKDEHQSKNSLRYWRLHILQNNTRSQSVLFCPSQLYILFFLVLLCAATSSFLENPLSSWILLSLPPVRPCDFRTSLSSMFNFSVICRCFRLFLRNRQFQSDANKERKKKTIRHRYPRCTVSHVKGRTTEWSLGFFLRQNGKKRQRRSESRKRKFVCWWQSGIEWGCGSRRQNIKWRTR